MKKDHKKTQFITHLGHWAKWSAYISLIIFTCTQKPALADDNAGTWMGTLETEQGECPTHTQSSMVIKGNEILFTPGGGSLILRGTLKPGQNHYHAQLLLKGTSHHPVPMVFNATYDEETEEMHGVYGTPTCRAHIVLQRS